MKKSDILRRVADAHNKIAQIQVSGDGAILMGDALKLLRSVVFELQEDVSKEEGGEEA